MPHNSSSVTRGRRPAALVLLASTWLTGASALWAPAASAVILDTVPLGGRVAGLHDTGPFLPGRSVTLQNNDGNVLVLNRNGPFTFPSRVPISSTYNVRVVAQPYGQRCDVGQHTGTVPPAGVTTLTVHCTDQPAFSVGGIAFGLRGSVGLNLPLPGLFTPVFVQTGRGSFTLPTTVPAGTSTAVTVVQQPPGQTCTVPTPTRTMPAHAVTDIQVVCVTHFANDAIPSGTLSFARLGVGGSTAADGAFFTGAVTATGAFQGYGTVVGLPSSGLQSFLAQLTVDTAGGTVTSGAPADAFTYTDQSPFRLATDAVAVGGAQAGTANVLTGLTVDGTYGARLLVGVRRAVREPAVSGAWILLTLSGDGRDLWLHDASIGTASVTGPAVDLQVGSELNGPRTLPFARNLDGTFTLDTATGAVSADGQALVAMTSQVGVPVPALTVGVPQSTNATAAMLQGRYLVTAIGGRPLAAVPRVPGSLPVAGAGVLGTFLADGRGHLRFSGLVSPSTGTTPTAETTTATYSVLANGFLLVQGPATLVGGLSPNGSVVLLTLATGPGSEDPPTLAVAVRQ